MSAHALPCAGFAPARGSKACSRAARACSSSTASLVSCSSRLVSTPKAHLRSKKAQVKSLAKWRKHHHHQTTRLHAFPPKREMDDVELLKGDAVVLWLFSLVQKTAASVAAPTFPGWLAPVTLDPVSFSAFICETAWLIAAWVTTSTLIGSYDLKPTGAKSEEGEMINAVNGAVVGWAVFIAPAYFGLRSIRQIVRASASVDSMTTITADDSSRLLVHTTDLGIIGSIPHGFPITASLAVVLLTMISWRGYVKVIGLMGWWRAGRIASDDETRQWAYLKNAQVSACGLALLAAVVDFVGSNQPGEW
jgi:hypothetical protein